MATLVRLSLIVLLVAACTHQTVSDNSTQKRQVAEVPSDDTVINYYTYDSHNKPTLTKAMTPEDWARTNPYERKYWLEAFWSANSRAESLSGKKHAACYFGDGQRIVSEYFNNSFNVLDLQAGFEGSKSSYDGFMVGVAYTVNYKNSEN